MKKQSRLLFRAPQKNGPTIDAERIGVESDFAGDLYHLLLTSSWPRLIALIGALYVLINLIFAGLYWLDRGSLVADQTQTFAQCFFFSVQTFSTIGYGGMQPLSSYLNIVMTAEALSGALSVALLTGLVFAKFSRPTARILFADVIVVGRYEGTPALMIRMANARSNQIFDAKVQVHALIDVELDDGSTMRRFFDLKLLRSYTPTFALSWTGIHLIDEDSPLFGKTESDLRELSTLLAVSIRGLDETLVQVIHARTFYSLEQIRWNARYVDIIERHGDNRLTVDYRKFHQTEPLAPATPDS